RRQRPILDRLQHAEAVQRRHLDVEKDEVRRYRADRANGLPAIGTFPDDLDIRLLLQQGPQPLTGQGFIVDDECPDHVLWLPIIERVGDGVDRATAGDALTVSRCSITDGSTRRSGSDNATIAPPSG